MMTRRVFLRDAAYAAAAAGVPSLVAGAADALGAADLTLGLLSDIHLDATPSPSGAAKMFRHALEYFRSRHVDGVLISGDLANAGLETELELVAKIWFDVFPNGRHGDGSPVANLMHYGDHDAEKRFYSPNLKEKFTSVGWSVPRSLSEGELRKEAWERLFHEPWSPVRHRTVRGYDFVLSNFMREHSRSAPENLGEIFRSLKLDAAKPFFYSQHRWMEGTYLTDEEMWGRDNGVAVKALSAFPNAVAFQGHTHYMLTDDRGVWINRFIAINNGSLLNQAVGRCHENGKDISWYKNDPARNSQMPAVRGDDIHGGMVLKLKDDIATLERRDFGSDRALGPDLVFSVDPAKRGDFCDAARAKRSLRPNQPDPSQVAVTRGTGKNRQGEAVAQVTVAFPMVRSDAAHARAHDFVVRALDPNGRIVCEKRVFSPGINRPEELEGPCATCVFAETEVVGAVRYEVRARNCWGI